MEKKKKEKKKIDGRSNKFERVRYQRLLYGRTSKCKESFSGPVAKIHSMRFLSPLWYVNVVPAAL